MPGTIPANRRTRRHPDASDVIARRWASMPNAARYLGVTDRTIRQMIADGRITGYRSSSRLVRVDLNEIDAAMSPFGLNAANGVDAATTPKTTDTDGDGEPPLQPIRSVAAATARKRATRPAEGGGSNAP